MSKLTKWLNQLSAWRFALLVAGFDLTVLLIAVFIVYLTTNGRVNLSFMAGYIPVMVITLTAVAVYKRRPASRQRPDVEQPHDQ